MNIPSIQEIAVGLTVLVGIVILVGLPLCAVSAAQAGAWPVCLWALGSWFMAVRAWVEIAQPKR